MQPGLRHPWPTRQAVLLALLLTLGLTGCRADPGVGPEGCAPVCGPTCRVPIYETVMVPVYEDRIVPLCRTYDVPVYGERVEPTFVEKRVPIMGNITQPVFACRKTPVTMDIYDPSRCEDRTHTLWCVTKKVQVGTERVPKMLGHRAQWVRTGTRTVREQTGWRKITEPAGTRCERVIVGERPVRKLTGWKTVPASEAARERQAVDTSLPLLNAQPGTPTGY